MKTPWPSLHEVAATWLQENPRLQTDANALAASILDLGRFGALDAQSFARASGRAFRNLEEIEWRYLDEIDKGKDTKEVAAHSFRVNVDALADFCISAEGARWISERGLDPIRLGQGHILVSSDTEIGTPAKSGSIRKKPPETNSGMPGRPTAKHLYLAEFERRASRGKTKDTIGEEALALISWIKEKRPAINPGGKRAVENNNRVAAYRSLYNIDRNTKIPFSVLTTSIDLRRPDGDTSALIDAIGEASERTGETVRLIVIDTLSRVFSGGNENSSDDMGALVKNIDLIREKTGAHVMLVHHTGKNTAMGARGHSLLRAAADTEIEVTCAKKTGISTASVSKQRDLATEGKFAFRLEVVALGVNKKGKRVTSCVAVSCYHSEATVTSIKDPALSGNNKVAIDALTTVVTKCGVPVPVSNQTPSGLIGVTMEQWREYFYSALPGKTPEAKKKAFQRASDYLLSNALVVSGEGFVWVSK